MGACEFRIPDTDKRESCVPFRLALTTLAYIIRQISIHKLEDIVLLLEHAIWCDFQLLL